MILFHLRYDTVTVLLQLIAFRCKKSKARSYHYTIIERYILFLHQALSCAEITDDHDNQTGKNFYSKNV